MKVEIRNLCLAVANYTLITAKYNNPLSIVEYLNKEFGTNFETDRTNINEILMEFIEKNCK